MSKKKGIYLGVIISILLILTLSYFDREQYAKTYTIEIVDKYIDSTRNGDIFTLCYEFKDSVKCNYIVNKYEYSKYKVKDKLTIEVINGLFILNILLFVALLVVIFSIFYKKLSNKETK